MKILEVVTLTFMLLFVGSSAQEPSRCVLPTNFDHQGFCLPYNSCQDFPHNDSIVFSESFSIINARMEACNQIQHQVYLYCCSHNNEDPMILRDRVVPYKIEIPLTIDELKALPNYSLFDHAKCGAILVDRVAHGNETQINEFPWMALLECENCNGTQSSFICGGSLISDRYVLTAAHCLESSGEIVSVRLGEHDTATEKDCFQFDQEEICAEPVQNIRVEKVIIHEDYDRFDSGNNRNDIGLIRLATAAVRKDNVKPICLPFAEVFKEIPPIITVIGFGITEKSNEASTTLLKANMPLVSDESCENIFKSLNLKLTSTQFCAGDLQNKVDSCKGDSGSPAFSGASLEPGNSSKAFQFGITSIGVNSCGKIKAPGVYTKVYDYLHWILDNMEP